jgi:glutathione-regulated potassium-efflux system ancillary protein KefC/glutathione-regulated potassium-efflux system protein KefB
MALGAFLAGVLLADSEFRHELEADIEPFKGLLLGLFFMAVGMSANLGLFGAEPLKILAVTAGFMALKIFAVSLLGMFTRCKDGAAWRLGFTLATGGEFAFVLFTLAAHQHIFDAQIADLLILAVTLSMMAGPLLLALYEIVARKFAARGPQREFDAIEERDNRVIIAGFGRVGQIVARVLRARRIPFTALDINQTHVDFVRRFGNKIYFGDATRLDLLQAAKTGEARLFVLAIDDVEASVKCAALVRRHFPDLPILARARNRVHQFRLWDLGIESIYRETFPSSLEAAHTALLRLGLGISDAQRAVSLFKQHDEAQLKVQHALQHDEAKLIQTSQEAAAQLKELFEADTAYFPRARANARAA